MWDKSSWSQIERLAEVTAAFQDEKILSTGMKFFVCVIWILVQWGTGWGCISVPNSVWRLSSLYKQCQVTVAGRLVGESLGQFVLENTKLCGAGVWLSVKQVLILFESKMLWMQWRKKKTSHRKFCLSTADWHEMSSRLVHVKLSSSSSSRKLDL